MPLDERANPLDQPDKLGRQSKPQQLKPRRFSFLCDKGQACDHLNAGVIRTMLSLGVRISFVQKISVSSTFRSIRADCLGKEFNTDLIFEGCVRKTIRNAAFLLWADDSHHAKKVVWLSQQFGRRHRRPGELGILHRDENRVCTDRSRVHHFRPRNTRRGRCHRA